MDHFLGVNMKNKKQSKRGKKGIKVVYISSPMKVETSASKFRALVQELTGKDSDIANKFIDGSNAENYSTKAHADDHEDQHRSFSLPLMNDSYNEESSSPDSDSNVFEPFDRFMPSMEGSFMSMFQSNFPHESYQLDVFN